MKKMKKFLGTVLCLALVITMLSACSTGNTGSTSSESTKPTETEKQVVTETPSSTEETTVTTEPSSTEEPTVTTTEPQLESEIIPLFPAEVEAQIHGGIKLEDIAKFEKYRELCNATETGDIHDSKDKMASFIMWTTDYLTDKEFVIRTHPEVSPESTETLKISLEQLRPEYYETYMIADPGDIDCLCLFEVGGETYFDQKAIAPLYYDSEKQCLIVATQVGQSYQLREIYIDGKGGFRNRKVDDPSRYGF